MNPSINKVINSIAPVKHTTEDFRRLTREQCEQYFAVPLGDDTGVSRNVAVLRPRMIKFVSNYIWDDKPFGGMDVGEFVDAILDGRPDRGVVVKESIEVSTEEPVKRGPGRPRKEVVEEIVPSER